MSNKFTFLITWDGAVNLGILVLSQPKIMTSKTSSPKKKLIKFQLAKMSRVWLPSEVILNQYSLTQRPPQS